jgi:phosphoglycolate phosphatase
MISSINDRLTVDAVIFDLDGTLIDSMDVYCKILNSTLERLGLPHASRKDIMHAIRDGDFDWNCVLPKEMTVPKEELIRDARTIIREIYPKTFKKEVKMIEGADDILREIAAVGMKIGLVTSTPRFLLGDKLYPLKGSGTKNLFNVIITTDDAANKKPAADPLIVCGEKLGMDREKMVYVGDTRTDIKAAQAAGMKAIGVLTGIDDYEGLMTESPYAIIDSVVGLRRVINFDS